jgi:hypothetical protein
MDKKIL